jgi:two-component system response regulator MprA
MARLLRAEGYGVVTAADGEQALERLQAGLEPCVIVLDLVMPRKNGFEFRTDQMRTPRFATIPTLAYSSDERFRGRSERLGIPFFRKPHDLAQLLDAIARLCGKDEGVTDPSDAHLSS